MKKFFDVEIDGQVELENGKTIGELKESSVSITDADVSGGGVMIVNITGDEENGYVSDKSHEEIINAMSVMPVLGVVNHGTEKVGLDCASLCMYHGNPMPRFGYMVYGGEAPTMLAWLIPNTDRGDYFWTVISHYLM